MQPTTTIACFRILEKTFTHDEQTRILMRPVQAHQSEEHRSFWDATPSGELTLVYRGHIEEHKAGSFVYIELTRLTETNKVRSWKLWHVTLSESSREVKLALPWDTGTDMVRGEMSMTVTNKDAWSEFDQHVGSRWSICIREKSN